MDSTNSNQNQPTRQEAIEKLRDMIMGIDIAMLTTVDDSDGTLRSRPMSTQQVEFDGDLYFFTYNNSPKADDVRSEHQVNVSYAHPGKDLYVSVSGLATMSLDRAKMQELWSPVLKAWFPQELETPNIALLRVVVDKAEYWASDGKIAEVINMVKAVITGTEADYGKNEKLDL